MVLSVRSQAIPSGDDVYSDPGFRTVIETHLNLLRNNVNTRREWLSPMEVHRYEGDFFGFLGTKGIPFEKRWIYLRVNGFDSSDQFGRDLDDPAVEIGTFQIYWPSDDTIEELRQLYMTQQR